MNILYLYTEIMGYTMATIRQLAKNGHFVHAVHWDHKKLTPFAIDDCDRVKFYKRSSTGIQEIFRLVDDIAPGITVISGWQDPDYLKIALSLRRKQRIVVTGFDDPWRATMRQHLASVLGSTGYFSKYFSHAWVTGPRQFEYARRLGFKCDKIIFDLYSADLPLFDDYFAKTIMQKERQYPHQFLFVGRLELRKGIRNLLDAWESISDRRRDWKLCLVGDGSLRAELLTRSDVVVKEFMQPNKLVGEIADSGCFVLPSLREPWGVVVHEFASAGLPLVLSNAVGAGSTFLIEGLNGMSFCENSFAELANSLLNVINSDDSELLGMAIASHELSRRITPKTSALNLLSLVDR